MKKLVQRLLIFFIGVPAVVSLIVFLPYKNHLALNLVIVLVSALGAMEFSLILKLRGFSVSTLEAAILGSLNPLAMTMTVSFGISLQITQALFIIGAVWLLVSEIFHKDDFSSVLNRLAAGFSVMIYPGLFLSWIIRMNLFSNSHFVILTFMLTVMANDSVAWASGMLLGNGNRGLFAVSPNKSIAGFIGGLTSSIIVCLGAVYLLPNNFNPDHLPRPAAAIALGLLSGIAVFLGDLSESAIKRCCGVKDSGFLVPGRGGVLDSIDSIALTAPVFFIVYRFLF